MKEKGEIQELPDSCVAIVIAAWPSTASFYGHWPAIVHTEKLRSVGNFIYRCCTIGERKLRGEVRRKGKRKKCGKKARNCGLKTTNGTLCLKLQRSTHTAPVDPAPSRLGCRKPRDSEPLSLCLESNPVQRPTTHGRHDHRQSAWALAFTS